MVFLESDNPEVFGRVVDWLFKEALECEVCHSSGENISEHELEWSKLWVLTGRLGVKELKEKSQDWYIDFLTDTDACSSTQTSCMSLCKPSSGLNLGGCQYTEH